MSLAKTKTPAAIFAALGDERRLRLVSQLVNSGPQSITELAAKATVTRQAVTKHLHVLEGAGLLTGTRRGREQLWELRAERLVQAQRYLDSIAQQWDSALHRLKTSIESE